MNLAVNNGKNLHCRRDCWPVSFKHQSRGKIFCLWSFNRTGMYVYVCYSTYWWKQITHSFKLSMPFNSKFKVIYGRNRNLKKVIQNGSLSYHLKEREPGWSLNKYNHIPFGTVKVTYNVQTSKFNSSPTRLFTFCFLCVLDWIHSSVGTCPT